jgi:hypothetical protein
MRVYPARDTGGGLAVALPQCGQAPLHTHARLPRTLRPDGVSQAYCQSQVYRYLYQVTNPTGHSIADRGSRTFLAPSAVYPDPVSVF